MEEKSEHGRTAFIECFFFKGKKKSLRIITFLKKRRGSNKGGSNLISFFILRKKGRFLIRGNVRYANNFNY